MTIAAVRLRTNFYLWNGQEACIRKRGGGGEDRKRGGVGVGVEDPQQNSITQTFTLWRAPGIKLEFREMTSELLDTWVMSFLEDPFEGSSRGAGRIESGRSSFDSFRGTNGMQNSR
ncbi:hypothetical protein CDAR_96741 [Caerostris darwini]|uniref:Uncharacterized protein n=1 Tax=Caerostris darwini TaxID=1538125 RepID=A0AAV4QUY8_9ARAC|nr:hypothetical protein CDAR_96741 [Caerostris darwini]